MEEFKVGDIVYHKANNLRMVVIRTDGSIITCKYVTSTEGFKEESFIYEELSNMALQDRTSNIHTGAIHKMESSSKA